MKRLIVLLAVLAAPMAQAQQSSPSELALGQKLMEEINQNVQLRAKVIELQAQIDKRKAEDEEAAKKAAPPKK
jgi:Ni/Co efflux regulator RcnB